MVEVMAKCICPYCDKEFEADVEVDMEDLRNDLD